MAKKVKKIKMRNNDRFTIMIIPRRDGRLREFSLKKGSLRIISGLLAVLIIYTGSVTYINGKFLHMKLEDKRAIAQLEKKAQELEVKLYALEEINEDTLEKNKDLLQKNKDMSEVINEVIELEKVLAGEIDKSDMSKKLRKSDTFAFNDFKSDLQGKIEETVDLIEKVREQSAMLKRIPSIYPAKGRLSSKFGRRLHPVTGESGKSHNGIDIANVTGTDIYASADGVVSFAGYMSGYGYLVTIDHQNGYKSYYAHNSKLLVKKNQVVERGERIALMGSTGLSTGTHCHFEVRYFGTPVDPLKLIN